MFNLDEQILRYLTIKLDETALEYLEQKKKNAALKLEEELADDDQVDSTDEEEND